MCASITSAWYEGGAALRRQHVLIADADQRLVRVGLLEERTHPVEHAPRRATKPGIRLVTGLRERRRRRFAQDLTSAGNEDRVGACRVSQFVEIRGIVVLRQQPEQSASRGGEWRCLRIPSEFDESPIAQNRAERWRARQSGRRHREHPVAPGAVGMLMIQHLPALARGVGKSTDSGVGCQRQCRDIDESPVLDGRRPVLQEPAKGKRGRRLRQVRCADRRGNRERERRRGLWQGHGRERSRLDLTRAKSRYHTGFGGRRQ